MTDNDLFLKGIIKHRNILTNAISFAFHGYQMNENTVKHNCTVADGQEYLISNTLHVSAQNGHKNILCQYYNIKRK